MILMLLWTFWTSGTSSTSWICQVRLAYHQDGLQLHHLLVIKKELEPEVHRESGYLCDLHHPSLNLFHFQ